MPQDVDAFLTQQLDVLDARGRRYLHTAAARMALVRVASVLPPVMLVTAAACLVWSLTRLVPGSWIVPIFAAFVLIAALGAYLAERPGHAIDRAAALTVFDDRLGLKDRLRTANEFLGLSQRDGFRNAALQETLSAVGLALAHPLTVAREPSPKDTLRRRWPVAAVAILLLVLACVFARPNASGGERTLADAARDAWRAVRLASASVVPRSDVGNPNAPGRAPSDSGTRGSAGAQRPDGDRGSTPSGRDTRGVGSDADNASNTASEPTDGGSGSGAGDTKAGAGSTSPGKPASDSASQTAAAEIAAGEAVSSSASSTDAATRPRPGDRTASAAPGQQGSAAPPAPRRPSPQPGQGMPQGKQSRSQKGDSGSSQPGQGNGQGSGGQRSGGEEALKKSRGISGLLLAVPMQDRLIGTANPGPVETVVRRAEPGRSPAATGDVGDRGTARGAVGRIPHRATTAQERLLLERYFRRGPVADRAPR